MQLDEQREHMSSLSFGLLSLYLHPRSPYAKKHKLDWRSSSQAWTGLDPELAWFSASPSIYDNEGMDSWLQKIVDLLEETDYRNKIQYRY